MVDQMLDSSRKKHRPRWRVRLYDGRWTLVATASTLSLFVLSDNITLLAAIIGFCVIAVATLAISRNETRFKPGDDDTILLTRLREQSANRFSDILSDPCFILDQKAVIVHHNIAAHAQFPGTTVGNPIAFSLRNPELLSAIEQVRTSGIAQKAEVHQTVPNEIWFEVSVTPLNLNNEGEASADRIVVVMHNLTEQKRVDAMRADFVANASHELRTPLTSLIGFIDTLQGPAAKDSEARERFLGIMRSQSERMSNLIDDLLSLSRIELRQHVKPTTTADLKLILGEVVEGLQIQAADANLEVSLTLPDEPVVISGDREELYEAFENLVDNAIKYGGDGKAVEITLAQVTSHSGFDFVVNIIDSGVGIAEEHVPRLSERFYRVDAETSRKKKGTGLGLAIVKHILNRHGGQMTIRSKVGVGTNVEILLPK